MTILCKNKEFFYKKVQNKALYIIYDTFIKKRYIIAL